jgi:hypothetical protein
MGKMRKGTEDTRYTRVGREGGMEMGQKGREDVICGMSGLRKRGRRLSH